MNFFEDMNERVERFSILDVKLAQAATFLLALIVAKFIPRIMEINIWWFIAFWLLCGIKPFYVFWRKK